MAEIAYFYNLSPVFIVVCTAMMAYQWVEETLFMPAIERSTSGNWIKIKEELAPMDCY